MSIALMISGILRLGTTYSVGGVALLIGAVGLNVYKKSLMTRLEALRPTPAGKSDA